MEIYLPVRYILPYIKQNYNLEDIIYRNNTRTTEEETIANLPLCKYTEIRPLGRLETEYNINEEFCRICLDQSIEGLRNNPCNCLGCIHEKCLISWVEKKVKYQSNYNPFSCEVCLKKYSLCFYVYKTFSCRYIKISFYNYCSSFIGVIIVVLILFSASCGSIYFFYFLIQDKKSYYDFISSYGLNKIILLTIIFLSFTFFILTFFIALKYICKQFCLYDKIKIRERNYN